MKTLAEVAAWVGKNEWALAEIRKRMNETKAPEDKPVIGTYVKRWTDPDPAARTEPLYSVGVRLIRAANWVSTNRSEGQA